jgi:hypothetical protein
MPRCRARTAAVTLAVPDLHAPFMHKDAVRFLRAVAAEYRPADVVLLGDVLDLHALSRFTRSPDGKSASDELKAARRQLAPLYDLFPVARVCWGNHDRRVLDRAAEAGIPAEAVAPMGQLLGHPAGWRWADQHEVGGVLYEHGVNWSGKYAHHRAAAANMQATVMGHIHAHAGVHYIANRKHLIWGFNCGALIDHKAYAFAYARAAPDKPIIGCGIIEGKVPRFVPMNLSRGGRWVGRLN